ncbi:MAG: hypothetical protein MHM6MM_002609 [Cercozoa sp. M6MM]
MLGDLATQESRSAASIAAARTALAAAAVLLASRDLEVAHTDVSLLSLLRDSTCRLLVLALLCVALNVGLVAARAGADEVRREVRSVTRRLRAQDVVFGVFALVVSLACASLALRELGAVRCALCFAATRFAAFAARGREAKHEAKTQLQRRAVVAVAFVLLVFVSLLVEFREVTTRSVLAVLSVPVALLMDLRRKQLVQRRTQVKTRLVQTGLRSALVEALLVAVATLCVTAVSLFWHTDPSSAGWSLAFAALLSACVPVTVLYGHSSSSNNNDGNNTTVLEEGQGASTVLCSMLVCLLLQGGTSALSSVLFASLCLGVWLTRAHSAATDTQSVSPFLPSPAQFWRHVRSSGDSERMLIFFTLNFVFMFVEFAYGFWTHSLSLIGDACHMLFDSLAVAVGLYADYVARAAANDSRAGLGLERLRTAAGFVNGTFLLLISASVMVESVGRLLSEPEIDDAKLRLVSWLGLLVNLVGIVFFHDQHSHHGHSHDGDHGHSHDHNKQALFWHVVADTLGSVGCIVSGELIRWKGWLWADAVCSVAISLLIVLAVYPMMQETTQLLMLHTPSSEDTRLRQCLLDTLKPYREQGALCEVQLWRQTQERAVAVVSITLPSARTHETDPQYDHEREWLRDKERLRNALLHSSQLPPRDLFLQLQLGLDMS